MIPSLLLAFVFGITSVLGAPQTGRTCGTHITDEQLQAAEAHFAAHRVAPSSGVSAQAVTVNVYFHVVSQDTSTSGGSVTDTQINNQIKVLNDAYAPAGISWTLANVTRTTNAEWFQRASPNTSQQQAMKNSLRQGSSRDLNVYTVGFRAGSGAGLLGYATFPQEYSTRPSDDGVVILFSSVPGGTSAPYNLGHTLTHEIGHWLGLYHTFQGGCGSVGDSVADTPPESSPAYGCPRGRDSCSGGGLDPINNYMDYSDDSCMNNLTPGQIERVRSQIATYRGISL
ncbi:metalloprotease [Coprinopsis marcescibilis]|uniref:Metalloprotease n=1 Tax=Coprinopsis marcescibilis TaxID=230819 RepID=A0A5C3KTG8_COPMA|nr:metalloprotease [Coprinopsis marcescibilis]